ncbi:MAG TPA: Yip1 family protein [Burkholderiales bacterium]|nr:Yip1 family protein [Burkholderiales bacterium]
MLKIVKRVANFLVRPAYEWSVIESERGSFVRVLAVYLAPLALIAPIAYAISLLIGGNDALRSFPDAGAHLRFALAFAAAGFVMQILGVLVTAGVVYLVLPLYDGARNYATAARLVAYAATPVWLAGIVLVAPLQKFPLLAMVILIALMHASYIFYLGLHQIAKVRLREAAECAAVVVFASLVLSTALGYAAGSLGLLPQM